MLARRRILVGGDERPAVSSRGMKIRPELSVRSCQTERIYIGLSHLGVNCELEAFR